MGKYGSKLNGKEYDRAIIMLYSDLPPVLSEEQRKRVRREELNLAIDHRLGLDFPLKRRDALWKIQQRIESHHKRMLFSYLFRKIFGLSLAKEAKGLAGYVIEEYAKELNSEELEQFFGKEETKDPSLPINE